MQSERRRSITHELPVSRKRRNTFDVAHYNLSEDCTGTHSLKAEPSGSLPKRKKHNDSLLQRKLDAKNKRKLEHSVKEGCKESCLKKCATRLTQSEIGICRGESSIYLLKLALQ